MTTIKGGDVPKRTGLEGLSLFELGERANNELFTYRTNLLSVSSEEGRDSVTEEYMEKTKSLREELDRREKLYLEYHHTFIGH